MDPVRGSSALQGEILLGAGSGSRHPSGKESAAGPGENQNPGQKRPKVRSFIAFDPLFHLERKAGTISAFG